MKRAVAVVVLLVLIAVLSIGGVQIAHLKSQVTALRHAPRGVTATQLKASNTQTELDLRTLTQQMIKIQASTAAYERAFRAQQASPQSNGLADRVDTLSQDFTNFCGQLEQDASLDLSIDLSVSCPTVAP